MHSCLFLTGEWGNIHQAVRNGAETVYVADLEKARLKAGDIYGFYELEVPKDKRRPSAMLDDEERERISEIAGGDDGGKGLALQWYLTKK